MDKKIKIIKDSIKDELLETIKKTNPNAINNPALSEIMDDILKLISPHSIGTPMIKEEDKLEDIKLDKKSDQKFVMEYNIRTRDHGLLSKKVSFICEQSIDGVLKFNFIENAPLVQQNYLFTEQRCQYAEANNAKLEINKNGGFNYDTYENKGYKLLKRESTPYFTSSYHHHEYSSDGIEIRKIISFNDNNNTSYLNFEDDFQRESYLSSGIRDLVNRENESNTARILKIINRTDMDKASIRDYYEGDLCFSGKYQLPFGIDNNYYQKLGSISPAYYNKDKYIVPPVQENLKEAAFSHLAPCQREALLKYGSKEYNPELDKNYYYAPYEEEKTGIKKR